MPSEPAQLGNTEPSHILAASLQQTQTTERVTKRFYEQFEAERAAFTASIKGIAELEHQQHYAVVMLNRLMCITFLQKKGFLDSNTDYLRHKLARSQGDRKDLFYRAFLCPLFF